MAKADGLSIPCAKREPFRPNTPVPGTLRVAFWLLIALAVIGAVNVGIAFVESDWSSFLDAYSRGWTEADPGSSAPYDAAVVAFVALRALLVGFAAFSFWAAFLVRWGVRWARIAFTVLAAIGAATVFGRDPVAIAITIVEVVAVVFLWVRPTSAFFNDVALERRQYRTRQYA